VGGEKLSFRNIKSNGEFVINIAGHDILKEVDFCGEHHGDEIDKFDAAGLTPEKAAAVGAKLIEQCPINLECRLKEIHNIEGANLVIGQIVKVHISQAILDGDKIDYGKLDPIVYAQKTYYKLGKAEAKRGFSKNDS
ncbi:MAG: flavin reductase family protein, partial [Actinomycetota bacterium]